jgi:hypothetical protein
VRPFTPVFHIQLRHFPHKACQFNMTEQELLAVARPWTLEQWVEVGERKWNPHEAEFTIVEGPHLEVDELSMGRGWQAAQHHGEDVTDRVLAQARAIVDEPVPAPASVPPEHAPAAGSPSVSAPVAPASTPSELLALLGDDPGELLQAWQLAAGRRPDLSPSQCLALAEETLRSLGSGA